MASYTPNYNLKKPAGTDPVQISDINGNMDIIDTQLKATNDQIVPVDITSSLSCEANVSIDAGGVYEIGKLVVVNLRVKVTGACAANTPLITGFPLTKDSSQNVVSIAINKMDNYIYLDKNGRVMLGAATTATTTFLLNASYVKA